MPQHGALLDPPPLHPGEPISASRAELRLLELNLWRAESAERKQTQDSPVGKGKKAREFIPMASVVAGGRINPQDGGTGCLAECVSGWEESLEICQRTLHQNN